MLRSGLFQSLNAAQLWTPILFINSHTTTFFTQHFFVAVPFWEKLNFEIQLHAFYLLPGDDLLELLQCGEKSATLKSTKSDYNTPPESPTTGRKKSPDPIFKTLGKSFDKSSKMDEDKPPVPPPRSKRGQHRLKSASPGLQGQGHAKLTSSGNNSNTDLLEAVANDLLKMGSELDSHMSDNSGKVTKKRPVSASLSTSAVPSAVSPLVDLHGIQKDEPLKGKHPSVRLVAVRIAHIYQRKSIKQ